MRTLLCELNRIHSHLVWLGTSALELGAISMFWYAFREREQILDLFELVAGYRMHTRYFQVGGLAEDIPRGFYPECAQVLRVDAEAPSTTTRRCSSRNKIWLERTVGLGLLSRDDAIALGQSGPVLRASGVDWDIRARASRTSPTTRSTSDVPVYPEGDVYARYRVHMDEMRESVRIVEQCLDRLENMEGEPWIADDRKVVLPPREELHTSMESLIHHFKIVTEGFRVPEGEVYFAIESPRGELGCYVCSDGGPKPWRVKFRAPSFVALEATATCMQRRADRRHDRDRRLARHRHGRGRPVSSAVRRDPGGAREVPGGLARARCCRRCGSRRSEHGWLSPEALREVADALDLTPAYCKSVASFYDLFHLEPVGEHLVEVCTNVSCALVGAQQVRRGVRVGARLSRRRDDRGRRGDAPHGRVPRRLRLGDDRRRRPPLPPRTSRRTTSRRSSRSSGDGTVRWRLTSEDRPRGRRRARPDEARRVPRRSAATQALAKARAMTPERGDRGAARRPSCAAAAARSSRPAASGRFVREAEQIPKPHYLVVNADESEPGSFKDNEILSRVPHRFIEGCLITAHAIECDRASSSTSAASTAARTRSSSAALEELRDKPDVRGDVTIVVHRGAGAYICGEETALLESLEGKRGQPRSKPPFPAIAGPLRVADGRQQRRDDRDRRRRSSRWAARSTRSSASRTRAARASSRSPATSCNGGNYEIEPGMSLREMIYDLGGGIPGGRELKAVDPGRLVDGDPDEGRDRRRLRLRLARAAAHGDGLGGDDRARRPLLHGAARHPRLGVLRARVVRQVHAVPRGHALDDRDPAQARGRATRRRRDLDLLLDVCDRIIGKCLCPLGDSAAIIVACYVDEVPRRVRRARRAAAAARSAATRPLDDVLAPIAACTRTRRWPRCPHDGNAPELVTLTIDEREVAGAEGHRPRRDGARGRDRDPRLLLRAAARAAGRRLPHVPRARWSGHAEAAGRLHADRAGRDGRAHRAHVASMAARGAERDARVHPRQPPARLPRLRQGRRVPAAGPDVPLRPRQHAHDVPEAHVREADPDLADDRARPRALHPLLPLHALLASRSPRTASSSRSTAARSR